MSVSKKKAPGWLIENISEISRKASSVYLLYMGFVGYSVLTIFGVRDHQLILKNQTAHLPIIDVDVSLTGFFIIAPLIAIGFFTYFQLYLIKSKKLIRELYEKYIPEKGQLYPWMINLSEDKERGFMGLLHGITVKFTLWLSLPVTLMLFAISIIKKHDPYLYAAVAIFYPLAGTAIVLFFWCAYEKLELNRRTSKCWKTAVASLTFIFVVALILVIPWKYDKTASRDNQGTLAQYLTSFMYVDLSSQKLVSEPETEYEGIYWADLKRVHLERANLASSILKRADLREAKIQGANLSEAYLDGANLSEANLENANLAKASLGKADLSNADLSGANLSEADLRGVNLTGAKLDGAIFAGAALEDARLHEVTFHGGNLRGANLKGANLWNADLRGAELGEATLVGVIFDEANLEGANLRNATLGIGEENQSDPSGKVFENKENCDNESVNSNHNRENDGADKDTDRNSVRPRLKEARLRVANLSYAELEGIELCRADLTEANLSEAKLNSAILKGANLYRAKLQGAELKDAVLKEAVLKEAKLERAELENAKLMEANLEKADLREADLSGATLTDANLKDADLRGADLRGAIMEGADISNANLQEVKLDEKQLCSVKNREQATLDESYERAIANCDDHQVKADRK